MAICHASYWDGQDIQFYCGTKKSGECGYGVEQVEGWGPVTCKKCIKLRPRTPLQAVQDRNAELAQALKDAISLTYVSEAAQDDEWINERERLKTIAERATAEEN